jgi:hypothetical protein
LKRINFLAILIVFSLVFLTNCGESGKNQPETKDTTAASNEGMSGSDTNSADKWWQTAGRTSVLSGRIVSLNNIVTGSKTALTRDQAEKMNDEGQPLVFQEGSGSTGNIYFVYNDDGTYAGSKLMDFVDKKGVTITGRALTQNDVRMIIIEKIDANQ